MLVLSMPLCRLGWDPACLTHLLPKLSTEYHGLCPDTAHPCSFVSLPAPAQEMFEPLSLAQFKVFYNFSYLLLLVYKAGGEYSRMAVLQKLHNFWIILFSHAV